MSEEKITFLQYYKRAIFPQKHSIIFACKSGDHIMLLLSRQLKKEHRVEYVPYVKEMSTMIKFNVNAALWNECYVSNVM